MQNSQSFLRSLLGKDSHLGNPFPSPGKLRLSGCHPGVLPCSAPERAEYLGQLGTAAEYFMDFPFPTFPLPSSRLCLSGTKGHAGNSALGSSGESDQGLELSLLRFFWDFFPPFWEGKFPKMRQGRKNGNGGNSLVLPPSEFLGCNYCFYLCYLKYSNPHP